jgi:hypothetical protein
MYRLTDYSNEDCGQFKAHVDMHLHANQPASHWASHIWQWGQIGDLASTGWESLPTRSYDVWRSRDLFVSGGKCGLVVGIEVQQVVKPYKDVVAGGPVAYCY